MKDIETTNSQDKPIWVQDLIAWLEKIEEKKLDWEQWVDRVQEVLAELPTHALPEEFWLLNSDERTDIGGSRELLPLSDEKRVEIQQQLTDAQLTAGNTILPGQVFSGLIYNIPPSEFQLLQQALDLVQEIPYEMDRSEVLVALAARLPITELQLLKQALFAAQNIENEYDRSETIKAIAIKIPTSKCLLVLKQACNTTQNHSTQKHSYDDCPRWAALAAIDAQLPPDERQPLLKQALVAFKTAAKEITAKEIKSAEKIFLLNQLESSKSTALAAITTRLTAIEPEVLELILNAAQEIQYETNRSNLLAALAVKLLATEPELRKQVLDPAENIENENYQSAALAEIAAQLPPHELLPLLKQALVAVKTDAKALVAVAAQLPPPESLPLLKQALAAAQNIKNEEYQSAVIQEIAVQLPLSGFQPILKTAQDIKNEEYQWKALAAIAVQLPPDEGQPLLKQVLQRILSQRGKRERISALASVVFRSTEFLIHHCSQDQLSTVLETIPEGKNSADKAKLLSALAPRLSPGLFPRALELIQTEISHPSYQADCLGNLAPYLRTELLSEALNLIEQHILGYSYPTSALLYLIPHLSLVQIQQALNIADPPPNLDNSTENADKPKLSSHPKLLTQILHQIAIRLSTLNSHQTEPDDPTQKEQLIQRILDLTQQHLTSEKSITSVLKTLAPSLNVKHLTPIQESILPTLESESYRAQVLAALATSPHLTSEPLHPIYQQAEALQQPRPKATALSALISANPKLHETVDKLLATSTEPFEKADLALILATRPCSNRLNSDDQSKDQTKALRAIRELFKILGYNYKAPDTANYLIQLASYLLPNQILEAKSIAQEIQIPYYRARSLLALATHFPEIRAEAQRQIEQVKNKKLEGEDYDYEDKYLILHIELLSQFATTVPEEISTLLKTVEDWSKVNPFDSEGDRRTYKRRRILIALKPHLPIRLVREIDRETGIGKAPKDLWERALFVLRNEYRQALKTGSLRNDATQDEDLLNLKDEINALTEMLLMRDLEPPVAVGILGGWGGGKSYIMHLMQTHMTEIRSQGMEAIEAWGLKNENSTSPDGDQVGRFVGHIYQIKFDAWTYAKSNLWASLMQTIFFELDRQISLEQKLQDALQESGISPLDSQSGAIWQALYETSDEDRQWFLENTLGQKALEKWKQNSHIQSDNDQLWDLFATSQAQALDNLKEIESKLKEKQNALKIKQTKILEDNTRIALYYTTSQAVITILNKRLGDSFAKDLQEKVIKKLTSTTQEFQAIRTQAIQWHDSVKADIESVFEQQDSHINFRFIQEFIGKNILLVLFCLTLVLAAIFLPSTLAKEGFDQLTQVFAGLTPLFGAIPIVQGLFKKGQTLYGEVRLGIVEYKQQLEQSIQRQLDTDRDFRTLNRQVQLLEKEIEAQYAAIPTNIYASVAEFVSNRLQQGGYQDHLGIMHQVKEDLAMLSKRLLPPPASSKEEYIAKLRQLEKVFPRGPARVVLYIDDLDRCPPKTVVEVLEAVQLLVKNPLFIAVLAIDERYINRALAQHYKGVLSLQGSPSAADYLEKIIQIPYRVRPIAEAELRAYLRAQTVIQDSETSGTKFNEFTPQEFNRLVTCCQEAELSPRSLKRLTNVYKLYKVLSRTRGHRPTPKEQQAILSLLVFSSRYPDLMRGILQEIGSHYEEGRHNMEDDSVTLSNVFHRYLSRHERRNPDIYLAQDIQKLRHDVGKLIVPHDLKLKDMRQIFEFVRTFSFVGDIGVDLTLPTLPPSLG